MKLIAVIERELRARGYRRNEDDPAYWTHPDWGGNCDKILVAVRDCLEREDET